LSDFFGNVHEMTVCAVNQDRVLCSECICLSVLAVIFFFVRFFLKSVFE